ncbi:MAG: hypothetical protein WAX69_14345, partial [Victivallales bacterium]
MVVEGLLGKCSKIPDPIKSDYSDCYYTSIFDSHNSLSTSVPQKFIAVFPCFFKRKLQAESKFRQGDRLKLEIIPFMALPQGKRSIQQSDDIDEIDLPVYFIVKSEIINIYRQEMPTTFSQPQPRVADKIPGPDETAKAARKEAVEKDIARIKEIIRIETPIRKKLYGDFEIAFDSEKKKCLSVKGNYVKMAWDTTGKLSGKETFMRWENNSFFTLDSTYNPFYEPQTKWKENNLTALISLNKYLAARNIDLIVVPIPYLFDISAGVFCPEFRKYHSPQLTEIVDQLLKNDIETIDLTDAIKDSLFDYQLLYYYHDYYDSHPHTGVAEIAAKMIASRLARYNVPQQKGNVFSTRDQEHHKLRWHENSGRYKHDEPIKFKEVLVNSQRLTYPVSGSPFLFTGNSFCGTPYASGNISAFFSLKTGIIPQLYECPGAANLISRLLLRNADVLLKDKKAVVLIVGSYHISNESPVWLNIDNIISEEKRWVNSKPVALYENKDLFTAIESIPSKIPADNIVLQHKCLSDPISQCFPIVYDETNDSFKLKLKLPTTCSDKNILVRLSLYNPIQIYLILNSNKSRFTRYDCSD